MQASVVHTAHTSPIYALHPTRVGGILSSAGDGQVLRWDPREPGTIRVVARMPSPVHCMLVDPDEGVLLAGTSAGELFVLDLARRQTVQRLTVHAKGIFAIARLRGDRIAVAGGDGILSIWQCAQEEGAAVRMDLLRSIPLCDAKLRALACSSNGEDLVVACGDGTLRVMDTTYFNERVTCAGHEGGANAAAFHPAKPVIVSGGKDGHLRMWDLTNGREVMSIPAHRSTIYGIAFDPEGLRCATVSRDKTVKLWEAASFDPVLRLDAKSGGHSHSVNALCWIGDELFTGGDDRKVIRWTGIYGPAQKG